MAKIKIHRLKIKPEYFEEVIKGNLTFQVRYNDRDFKKGDLLTLEEFDSKGYTGKYVNAEITYVLDDVEFMRSNYVALGIKLRIDRGIVL